MPEEEKFVLGVDIDKDKEPDLYVILKGNKQILGLVLTAFGVGLFVGRLLQYLGL